MKHLEEVISVLKDAGITLLVKKYYIGFYSIKLLGKLVDRFGLATLLSRLEAITKLEEPKLLSILESFIGIIE